MIHILHGKPDQHGMVHPILVAIGPEDCLYAIYKQWIISKIGKGVKCSHPDYKTYQEKKRNLKIHEFVCHIRELNYTVVRYRMSLVEEIG